MTSISSQPSKMKTWLLASRPKTLFASSSPVILGLGIAISLGVFRPLAALVTLLCALLMQIGANLVNDVVDYQEGTDTEARIGPLRVTQAGLLSPREVWTGTAVVFAAAALGGVYLGFVAGWPIILTGAVCILAALAYTTGPMPLSRYGFGELFVMIFFGFVAVCGTVYIQAGWIPAAAYWCGAAAGALTVNIIVVNNVRDIGTDRDAGRKNIPILLGRPMGELEYFSMQALAYIIPLILWLSGLASPWVLTSELSLVLAIPLAIKFHRTPSSPAMNPLLGETSKTLFFYCVLLAFGFVLRGIF
jgi:1,4-dihydroxy-2-naphthoate octaprenyltransferase